MTPEERAIARAEEAEMALARCVAENLDLRRRLAAREMKTMDYQETTYSDGHGHDHKAIHILWGHVEAHLGHPHSGHPEDDDALVDQLILDGAPEWVREAEGWTDERGWGLIGPEMTSED